MADRFFFVHLQKTGGTALFQRLRHCFGAAAVYPRPEDDSGPTAVLDVGHLVDDLRAHGEEVSVITGHFPLCVVDVLEGPFATFTVLRDPVERTLSLLRRRQRADEHFEGWTLDAIYDEPSLRPIIWNHMVKMLSMTPAEMTTTPLVAEVALTPSHLERAQQNLAERIDVFGFQEDFDELCAALETRFGWDLGPARVANRTPPQPVPAALRDRIAEDNQLDVELYAFAERLHADRRAAAPRGELA